MNAAIDFGNTSSKLALFDGQKRIGLERDLSDVELIEKLKKLKVDFTIVASVTKSPKELISLFEDIPNVVFLNDKTPIPIINAYGTPDSLGYDRIAAAAGANSLFPNENCLIIDLGTAIKYDFINKNATFIGGIISPGLEMRFNALHTFTKKLPLVKAEGIPTLIGNSTKTCMQSGVVNGIIVEINGIIAEYQKEGKLKIIISGGDANFFESRIKNPTFAASNLVLEGLNRILIYNVENKKFST